MFGCTVQMNWYVPAGSAGTWYSFSATPVMSCISVIALLWLTTVANFGGPAITGRIGAVTVWGVILPVGAISIIGWFWFSKETFAAGASRLP